PAGSARSSRGFCVAASGTSRKISKPTGCSSGASKPMGLASWNTAAMGAFNPLMRPWGMATPWPRPVDPRRSRANRLSVISARDRPCRFSNSSPASSKARFLLVASTPTRTWAGGRMDARRFMMLGGLCTCVGAPHKNVPAARRNARGPLRGLGVGSHDALGCVAVVVLHAGLVAADLAIELVDQVIQGRVEIVMGALGEHVVALHVDLAF